MSQIIILLKKLWSFIASSKIIQYTILLFVAFAAGKRSAKQEYKADQLTTEIKDIQIAMEQKNDAEKKSDNIHSNTIDQRMRKHGWLRD